MIKITDKVTLRATALQMALGRFYNDYRKSDQILETANKFAQYIQGDANLPEFESDAPTGLN